MDDIKSFGEPTDKALRDMFLFGVGAIKFNGTSVEHVSYETIMDVKDDENVITIERLK